MEIDYLADHPHFIPMLADWHHQEWAYLREGDTVEARLERLRSECGHREIPTTVVAFDGPQLIGSAMIIPQDMDTHPHLTPWLASVFVAPAFRGQGIGATLVRRIMDEARALGVKRFYLYTPSAEDFYARLGWKVLERTTYGGKPAVVMACDLS